MRSIACDVNISITTPTLSGSDYAGLVTLGLSNLGNSDVHVPYQVVMTSPGYEAVEQVLTAH